jgi:selenide,water dikinase
MAAIAHMVTSNRRAAVVLARHGARAATDVTGFGLLGHLVEMTKASGVDVTLFLDSIPVLDGARDTIADGVFSSLQPQNVRLRRAIRDLDGVSRLPLFPILFDPQTAGGLLAAVPPGRAEDCVAALVAAGYSRAALIGRASEPGDALAPVTVIGEAMRHSLLDGIRPRAEAAPANDPQHGDEHERHESVL